jgi:hypothetical protein
MYKDYIFNDKDNNVIEISDQSKDEAVKRIGQALGVSAKDLILVHSSDNPCYLAARDSGLNHETSIEVAKGEISLDEALGEMDMVSECNFMLMEASK